MGKWGKWAFAWDMARCMGKHCNVMSHHDARLTFGVMGNVSTVHTPWASFWGGFPPMTSFTHTVAPETVGVM